MSDESVSDGPADPVAARAADPRVHRAVRGAFAGTLILEAIVVLLVPRTVARFGPGLTGTRLAILLALAVLFLVAAGVQRRRFGVRLGTLAQVGLLACGFLTEAMFFVGVVFALVWYYLLRVRRDLLGGPLLPG